MASEPAVTPNEGIDGKIHLIRGQRAMLDSDLAAIYGVATMALNQAAKRNIHRFPTDFAFRLTRQEFTHLISQTVISKKGRGGRRTLPWVFTEHGAAIRQLLNAPADEAPNREREIGFHIREQAPPYRVSRRA